MKTLFAILMFAVTILSFTSCHSDQTADESLKDDTQRTKIISTLVKDPAYSKEMMGAMMDDDNCKNMMTQHMMEKPEMKSMMMDNMMNICKSDSSMCKMMMGKTMDMCESDEAMCKMMMNSMQSHSGVMKSVKGCCAMDEGMSKKDAHMSHHKK